MSDESPADRLRDVFNRWNRSRNPPDATPDAKHTKDTAEDTMNDQDTLHDEDTLPTAEETNPNPAGHATTLDLEQMTGERDVLKDRLARLQAEFDNFRKREANARTDARATGIEAAIEPFLSVMDNFALALGSNGTAEQLRTGVELILKQMEEALRGLNVQAVETVGTQFDPRVHEALGSVETAEHPDHQVLEEIRRGYRLRDKLLRPALVRIASNPQQVNDI